MEAGNIPGDAVHFQYTNSSHSRKAEREWVATGKAVKDPIAMFGGSDDLMFARMCRGECDMKRDVYGRMRPVEKPPYSEEVLTPLPSEKK